MKNTLTDQHNLLHAMLEELSDPDLNGRELDAAIKRTDAICRIVQQDIALQKLRLEIVKTADALLDRDIAKQLPGYMEVAVDALEYCRRLEI